MQGHYVLTQTAFFFEDVSNVGFGIAYVEVQDGIPIVLESTPDLSADRASIEKLVKLCNELELDPIHIKDVIYDFLSDN